MTRGARPSAPTPISRTCPPFPHQVEPLRGHLARLLPLPARGVPVQISGASRYSCPSSRLSPLLALLSRTGRPRKCFRVPAHLAPDPRRVRLRVRAAAPPPPWPPPCPSSSSSSTTFWLSDPPRTLVRRRRDARGARGGVPTPSNDSFGLWRDLPPRARLVDAVGRNFRTRGFRKSGRLRPCFEVRRARSNLRDWKHSTDFPRVALSPSGQSGQPRPRGNRPRPDIVSRARVFVTVGETARDRHRSKTMSAEEEAQMTRRCVSRPRVSARATLPSRLSCFWVCPGRPSRCPGRARPASRASPRSPRARSRRSIARGRLAPSRAFTGGAPRFFHASRVLAIMNCRPPRPRAIPSPRARTRPRSC